MRSFKELQGLVVEWADDKGIVANTQFQILKQLDKTNEELQELKDEVEAYFEALTSLNREYHRGAAMLEAGDVLVTLIVASACLNVDLEQCLDMAYEKIKNRTGKVVNGQFCKN